VQAAKEIYLLSSSSLNTNQALLPIVLMNVLLISP